MTVEEQGIGQHIFNNVMSFVTNGSVVSNFPHQVAIKLPVSELSAKVDSSRDPKCKFWADAINRYLAVSA